jgi:N-acetylglucosaminyl-diphospho-decaprenol L-rhamnosyltransferase
MLDVAVVIVSWNVRDYLSNCLRSVYVDLEYSDLHGEVWVVDNASTDGTQELLADLFPGAHLILNGNNPGFGAANNQGIKKASDNGRPPRYFLLLNPDTIVRPGALGHLTACLDETPNAGLAGARLVYADGRFQHSAFEFPGLLQLTFDLFSLPERLYESRLNGRYPRSLYRANREPFEVDHPLGAAMLVRSNVALATNGFDESYHMYCEEIDWCWRIRRSGWGIYAVPKAEIVHYGGESTRQVKVQSIVNLWRSRAYLYKRHHGRLRFLLSRWMVQMGMQRKAKKTSDDNLKRAYIQAADAWRNA